MLELTRSEVVGFLWVATSVWVIIAALASLDAMPELVKSRRAYKLWPLAGDGATDEAIINFLQARGDYRRSRAFAIGFLLALFVGMRSLFALVVYGPPETVDASLGNAIAIAVIDVMLYAFWRGKHADRKTALEIEKYVEKAR